MSNIYLLPIEAEETMKLYMQCFDQDTGELIAPEEVAENILKELETLQNKKDEIIEWALKKRGNSEMNLTGISEEIKRLQTHLSREQKTVEKMEKLINRFIPEIEKPVTISNWTLSYRKSEQTIIDDDQIIPSEYKKEKTTVSIDKVAIKNALKDGGYVPGARILEVQNLQIR